MYSKSISILLASFTLIAVGALAFIDSMSFSCGTMQHVLYKAIPASVALGLLGFLIGAILDNARFKR